MTIPASHAKYVPGSASSPSGFAIGVNGIAVTTAIPSAVSVVTGSDARLFMDDKRLAPHRLYEPSGLEDRGIEIAHRRVGEL